MKHKSTRVIAKPLSAAQQKVLDAEVRKFSRLSTTELLAKARPLSSSEQKQWNQVRRGRPKKPTALKSVRVLFTIEPDLLAKVDRYAKANKLTRAELIASGLRRAISA